MIKVLIIKFIDFYQYLSKYTKSKCRFYPSCSSYAREAITQYGVIAGTVKTISRVSKCHPWHPGGYDPVK